MPKGDNMTARGQRRTRLKKLLTIKQGGETAQWAVIMLNLMDEDLDDDERARYNLSLKNNCRRAPTEPDKDKKEDVPDPFA
jgi:hypothetical protein